MRISWFAIAAATLAFCGSAHAAELVTNGDFTDLTNGLGKITNVNGGPSSIGPTSAVGWDTRGYNFVFNVANQGVPPGNIRLWDQANGGASTWDGKTLSGAGNFVALDGAYQTAALTQKISGLTVGDQYTLSFNYAFAQQYGFNQTVWQDLTASLGPAGDLSAFNVTLPSAFHSCTGSGTSQVCSGGYWLNPEHSFSGWSTYTTTITADSATEFLSFLADGSKQVPPFALISDVSLVGAPGPGPAGSAAALLGLLGLGYARRRLRGQA